MKKLFYFCLLFTGCSIQTQEIRDLISLEGSWNFRIDSTDVGISEQWYSGLSGKTVILPGSMAENGMGDEVTVATDWTGNIIDSSWFFAENFKKYREPGNLKIPF